MNDNDEFDRVLDEALAEYRNAEPLAGMERRVLQRVRMKAERRQTLWRWCGAFAACAAMLAIAAWIGLRDRDRHEIVPGQSATAERQRPPAEAQSRNENTHVANDEPVARGALVAKAMHTRNPNVAGQAVLANNSQAPVRPQFPSPTPLNSEERALLALAQTHPEVLSRLPSNQDNQEIAIAPINIQPLVDETSVSRGEN